jgi:hypothetical protein
VILIPDHKIIKVLNQILDYTAGGSLYPHANKNFHCMLIILKSLPHSINAVHGIEV